MRVLAVIPARMAAGRLPGKPLADIGGRSLVERVWRATMAAGVFDEVIVASDSRQVLDAVAAFGGRAELTSSEHKSGTDRVAEVAASYPDFDVVANVQGDLVDPDPELFEALVAPFADADVEMTTVAVPLTDAAGMLDPNTVKVVCDVRGDALYFSRSPIPHGATRGLHHLGLYAFRPETLRRYATLPTGALEAVERLEQLRALEAGIRIRVGLADTRAVMEINTTDDLRAAREAVASG